LKANGSEIDVGDNSSPDIADWNEDGLLDLLVGCESESSPVRLYLNSGTTTQYEFTDYTSVQADGADIKHYRCMITVADLNKDGKKDLLVGDGTDKIYFYENKGTNADPQLTSKVALKADGSDIDLDGDTRQCVTDWNEDGANDLIAGDYNENVYLILGIPVTDIVHDIKRVYLDKPVISMLNGGCCIITLKLEYQQDITVTLFSPSGKIVQAINHSVLSGGERRLQLDLSTFPTGVYFLHISVNKKCSTYRLVYIE
jgi:hypothetical protein